MNDKSFVSAEGSYEVEEIIKHRVVNKKKEYFVKWRGYSHTFNTWEPVSSFYSLAMINDYEKRLTKTKSVAKQLRNICDDDDNRSCDEQSSGNREERDKAVPVRIKYVDLELEELIDVKRGLHDDKLYCLMKFKSVQTPQFVSIKTVHKRFPQELIAYYERRLYWTTQNGLEKISSITPHPKQ